MNGNYQLTNVEAQRVMAVIDELALDLRLAFCLTPQTLSTEDISSIVGPENERFFLMQVDLEKQFAVLGAQLEGPVSEFVSDSENDTQDAVVHDFFDIARRLRKNTREICRFLRSNPALSARLSHMQQQPAELAERFIVVLDDLKAQTLRSLGTSVEEDKSDKEHFENVSVREKTLTEQERMLTKDLATVKKDREKAVTARDAQIAALEAEKAELQQMTANAGKAVGEGNNANEIVGHDSEVEMLDKKLKKLLEDLAKTKTGNKDSEETLKKRSYKKETDVETWVQKYDTEMGAINDEMTALAEQYMSEKAKMRRLENHFEGFRLSEGADFAAEMMQMANELEVEAKRKRLGDAACLIQSSLRGHKGREAFNKAKKKGGKGKKKK